VETRQAGTLGALKGVLKQLQFQLLGLDIDSGRELFSQHVLGWVQGRERPVFMTRIRPYTEMITRTWSRRNERFFGSGSGMTVTTTPR